MNFNTSDWCNFFHYDIIDSTNEEAKRLAFSGVGNFSLIVADEQTSGKGRLGRKWISESGNLFFSLLLKPDCLDCDTEILPQLSFITAVALRDSIIKSPNLNPLPEEKGTREKTEGEGSYYPDNSLSKIKFKWPNDLVLNGKKFSGILLESGIIPNQPPFVVIGVGVNMENFPDEKNHTESTVFSSGLTRGSIATSVDLRVKPEGNIILSEKFIFPPTSLKAEGISNLTRNSILESFLYSFKKQYDIWHEDGFSVIRKKWLSNAAFLGEEIALSDGNKGIFEGMDKTGRLLLRKNNGSLESIIACDVSPSPMESCNATCG